MECLCCAQPLQGTVVCPPHCQCVVCGVCFVKHIKDTTRIIDQLPMHSMRKHVQLTVSCPQCATQFDLRFSKNRSAFQEKRICFSTVRDYDSSCYIYTEPFIFHGIMVGMFPIPHPHQLYHALGYKWLLQARKPLRNEWRFMCDLCLCTDRASFPYPCASTLRPLDDPENSAIRYVCSDCHLPGSPLISENREELARQLELPKNSGPVVEDHRFHDMCMQMSESELSAVLLHLHVVMPRTIVFPLALVEKWEYVIDLCSGGPNTVASHDRRALLWRGTRRKLVRFTTQTLRNRLHKCLHVAVDNNAPPITLALLVYWLRRGVFDALPEIEDYDEAIHSLNDFIVNPNKPKRLF